jgi:hypothetical protein
MKLKIKSVYNGSKTDEYVWLEVLQDCNLRDYAIADNTFEADGDLSNKHPHIFRFPSTSVKAGEIVVLHTGKKRELGTYQGTKRHRFFWGLGSAVWNDNGDKAILLQIAGSAAVSIPAKK